MPSLAILVAMLLLTPPLTFGESPAVSVSVDESVSQSSLSQAPSADFLIDPKPFRANFSHDKTTGKLTLSNGLLRRTWSTKPNGACIEFTNLMTGNSIMRAIKPEARITIDGKELAIGGLVGQKNLAYLTTEWLTKLTADPNALRLHNVRVETATERIKWKRRRHTAPGAQWPPPGVHLVMTYAPSAPAGTDQDSANSPFSVTIHYEIYDGIPVIGKWLSVTNQSNKTIVVDRFRCEELAVVEHANWVEKRGNVRLPKPDYLHVETDFAFGGFTPENANRHTINWEADPDYHTQVNYLKQTPCLLVVEPTYGPAQDIVPGETFESFRTFELVYDDGNRERRGLMLRRMYRTLAPWVTENPITHHLLNSNPAKVREAIDAAAEVGFEAIIMSFGSGFNMESTDEGYLKTWTEVADYAESKGIELGSYSLFSSRSVGGGNDVVSPEGQKPTFGRAPAATSKWGLEYYAKLKRFYDTTGFDQFENDGPYPGDVDVTPRPPYQKGMEDSRWAQWKIVTDLYKHLRANGVYINQPDYYFFMGGNKTGMGYREVNWSLPRTQQIIHTRQNIYDGTWTKPPSMGWMHVPLAQYHGGGPAATIEPLVEHLDHYERIMYCNLGLGVQAHYRGPRLFDTDRTKTKVKEVVDWYKKYRDILESDVIHGRRADGRDIDWMLHVNPSLESKGMLCVYNPLDRDVSKSITFNVYYTGLNESAKVLDKSGRESVQTIDRRFQITMQVDVPANGMSWYVMKIDEE